MFVCTWCALPCLSRRGLEWHQTVESPECGRNRTVSSGLQSRYGDADAQTLPQPGEYTLWRVRAPSCPHIAPRKPYYDDAGNFAGFQCSYCYSVLTEDNS